MKKQHTTQTKTSGHDRPSQANTQSKTSAAPAIHPMLHLQHQVGNQAVGRLIQAKLTVGEPNDVYEQEADRNTINSLNATVLPDNLKSGIKALSGLSMDDVKVHYNSSKPNEMRALAYAQGADIHIAPGQEQHLPHEAWHVVQQKQGRVMPIKGMAINDDPALEKEADEMGRRLVQIGEEHQTTPRTGHFTPIMQKETKTSYSNYSTIQRILDIGVGAKGEIYYPGDELPKNLPISRNLTSAQKLDVMNQLKKWADDTRPKAWKFDNWALAIAAAIKEIATISEVKGGTKERQTERIEFDINGNSVSIELSEAGMLQKSQQNKLHFLGLQHTLSGHAPELTEEVLIGMAIPKESSKDKQKKSAKGSGKWISHKTLLLAVKKAYDTFKGEDRKSSFQDMPIPDDWGIGYRRMKITDENREKCKKIDINDKSFGVFQVKISTATVAFTEDEKPEDRKIKTIFPFAEQSVEVL
jgi:Domain of unknown function (DUF4157)